MEFPVSGVASGTDPLRSFASLRMRMGERASPGGEGEPR